MPGLLNSPTLSAYTPTWRDRLASLMMGDGQASPERRRFVGGLMGSTGLGSNGVGVVDATPVGGLLAAQEAAQAGDPKGMAMAMLPMPGAKAKGILAYHGSPHSFDRFDLSKIGTGEGAQAYGHGLYFAEHEPVAKGYRDNLTNGTYVAGNEVFNPSTLQHMNIRSAARRDLDEAIEKARKIASDQTSPVAHFAAADLERLTAMKSAGAVPNPGHMYQVRINADPEHFLDWDKPLSEQPATSQKISPAFKDVIEKYAGPEYSIPGISNVSHARGEDVIMALREAAAQNGANYNDERLGASKSLLDAGIPGIKYLDQGSRNPAAALPRLQSHLSQTERMLSDFDRLPLPPGMDSATWRSQLEGKAKSLRDQIDSTPEPSRNYVVFDDKLIDILRKYGIAGMLGGGAAMGAANQGQNGGPQL